MVLAIVLAVVIWLAQGLGGLFTGGATDPESGPLLALLAVAFWPAALDASSLPLTRRPLRIDSFRIDPSAALLRTESRRYGAGRRRDMGGPAWLTDIFAAVMITVAAYCASRLVVARWWRRPTDVDTDGAHVVMGVAMAGMLVAGPALRLVRPLGGGLRRGRRRGSAGGSCGCAAARR